MWGRIQHRVLIVSDPDLLPVITPNFLKASHIRILTSTGDQPAFDLAVRQRPRLIIEDLTCGDDARIRLCRQLKSHPSTRSIPLIGIAGPDQAARARRAGPDALVHRPLVQRQYFETVRRFLPMPERRNPRQPVNLRFRYRIGDEAGQAFTRDLSEFGAFVKTDRVLAPNTRMSVCFCIPGRPEEVRCRAVVRRSVPMTTCQRQLAGFAIVFEEMNEKDRDRLSRFVNDRQPRRRFSF
jgi:CheY-like chemotaxis protein